MPVLFAISSRFDGRWERILLSQFLKTSCIESFHLVELFCKFMTFLSWLMSFSKIILHQKGAVMNSFYFFSYLFCFVHFFLKFSLMGKFPRNGKHEPPGKLGVPLFLDGFGGVPQGIAVCVLRRGVGRQHDFGVNDFAFMGIVFLFLVVFGKQPFPALVGGRRNG